MTVPLSSSSSVQPTPHRFRSRIRDGEAESSGSHSRGTSRSSRERACSVTMPSRPVSAHSCARVHRTCPRYIRTNLQRRWRRRTRASSASGCSSAALLMACKAPSYTNFSHKLCYFEHERRADVSSARLGSARLAKTFAAKWKKRPSANYTAEIIGG